MKEIDTGDIIGSRFLVEERIGRGGMAKVYCAYDIHAEHDQCAVKTPHPDYLYVTGFRIRFQEEGQIGIRLANAAPHLFLQVYAILEETRHNCEAIVMERFDGKTFGYMLETLQDSQVIAIVLQVLEAVRIAANNGIVLKDLKPSNILCNAHGGVRVIDFGLARSPKSTFSDGTVGTYDFTAPEVKDGGKPGDVRSDLYSVGAILQEWIDISNCKSDGICAIAKKLMNHNPKDRFQEPEDVMIELVDVMERQGLGPELHSVLPFMRMLEENSPLIMMEQRGPTAATLLERISRLLRSA